MSVGQVAGGIVGGIVGWFVGGPTGALKGAAYGMTLGGAAESILNPPKGPHMEGPRLNDLSVQTSTYGVMIPRVYGTIPIVGNIIWLQNDKLTETATTTESGGKGGGPTSSSTTYSYSATFAVGLCEGPITGIRRIWIGPDLFYDAGSYDIGTIIASNTASSKFKLYLGTDTQLPDPSIQADKGVANTPAYRGLAYIVFNDLPLADYSNSLMAAQVKVEVITSATDDYILEKKDEVTINPEGYRIAVSGNYAYVSNKGSHTFQIFNIANPDSVFNESTTATYGEAGGITVSGDYVYVSNIAGSYALQIFDITNKSSPLFVSSVVLTAAPNDVVVSGDYAYSTSGTADIFEIVNISDKSLPFVCGSISTGASSYPVSIAVSGDYAYIINNLVDTLQVYDVSDKTSPSLVGSIGTGTNPNDIVISGDYAYVINYGDGYFQIFDISTPSSPSLEGAIDTGSINPRKLDISGDYVFITHDWYDTLQVYDVSDKTSPSLVGSIAIGSGPYHDIAVSGNYAYVACYTADVLQSFFFAGGIVVPGTVTLGSIVQAECLKSNLISASDIDVTDLTDTVRGYKISSLGAIRAAIEPLRASWPFDVIQSGYDIKFKTRGSSSVVTIPYTDLNARNFGDQPKSKIINSREMDSILPYKVTIKHLDPNREYDVGEQYAERLNTDSVNTQVKDLPIVLTATEAAQKAEMLLYLYWLERYDISFVLPPSYDNLEPGDVITVTGENLTYYLRLTGINYTAEGRLECQAKYDSAAIYVPAAEGEEGSSTGVTLSAAGLTVYDLLDIPLLNDVFDTPGYPVAMTGYLSGWPGGVLYRTDDGQTWTSLQGFAAPGTTIGRGTDVLADYTQKLIDKKNTLNVIMFQGTLSSVTELQMLNGSNHFAYGADGRWEIIAAQNCVLQGDGSYTLSDMLRGRYGTEWATGTHQLNDHLVLLNTTDLAFIFTNTGSIGLERTYRGVTLGDTIDSVSDQAFTYSGVNLECLSPVYLNGNNGSFSGGSVDDDFTGADNDPPNTSFWTTSIPTGTALSIQTNRLKIDINNVINVATTYSIYKVIGDFDISFDFETLVTTTTNLWLLGLVCWDADGSERYGVDIRYQAGLYYYGQVESGGIPASGTVSTSDTSGSLRITRVGTTISTYYWNGSSWSLIYSATGTSDNLDLRLRMQVTTTTQVVSGAIDNLVVVADSIYWPGADWTLTWIRRTRIGGEWRDYVDATLGETTESYEVDIYDGSGYTTVLRTLTSSTTSVSYTSAQQITDFGSNQRTLYVKVYQLSATVGRGYPLTTSITR